MARSLDVFNQRHKSGAPTLMISSSTREDLPQLNRSADAITRRRRAHSSESDQKDFIASPWPSDDHNQSTHTDGRSDTLNSTMDERDIEEILDNQKSTNHPSADDTEDHADAGTISARDIEINEVQPLRDMKIATLRRSLGRVLFSPGPLPLRDSRTGVWNFDPSLHDIPQPDKFAFHRCPPYITPSQDRELVDLAEQHRCRFVGSTSTLTKALSQIYFAISGGKGVDLSTLSQDFSSERTNFTPGAELPASIIVDRMPNGIYSVDSDKRWDVENVISDFGRILEKMLTCETSDFKRFLLSSPESAVSEDERTEKEAYRYQRMNSLLMRSQLDCHDPRLPGNGVFDIKTRACLPVRHDRANYQANSVYDIWKDRGYTQSYEREYYDLLRAGMLKFSLQVRIGGMDGIFLAYHNTSRLFGFQYISLSEIDERIFGSTEMAEQAFRLSVSLLEVLLQKAVAEFPDQAINILLKHSPSVHAHSVTAYVEPKHWDGPKGDRPIRAITLTMKNILDDEAMHGPVTFSVDEKVRQSQNWSVHYIVSYNNVDEEGLQKARRGLHRLQQDLLAMNHLTVPAGQTVKSMMQKDNIARRRERKARQDEQQTADVTDESLNNVEHDQPYPKIKWREPGARQIQLREEAQESGQAYERRKKTWKKGRYAWTVHTHSIPSII
uniref:Mitochondrial protein Pet127 n=1 Tax=Kwoniella bestiolae CBS 10118 TaxID=1296100 RepID=A0A1B9GBB0_9TREE|nr:hypothetical protein I302_03145 [Kwoniella bestiolae CBS 10118]OCF28289.1 hypothetical protein I302_03145 [Kwoniella bestiolae CBS 10118]